MIAQELEVSLHMAFVEARQQRHEFITVEHLLLALLDNPSAAEVLKACSANSDDLRKSLTQFIKENTPTVGGSDEVDTQPTLGFQRVIQRAIMHVQSTGSGKKEVTGANVLVAIFGEKDSHAVYYLHQQGVTRLDVVNFIAHGIKKSEPPEPAKGAEGNGAENEKEEASDGKEAIEILRQWPADLAICDFAMKPMDGVEFTRLVRNSKISRNPYLPIIMMTGHADKNRVVEARDAGVTELLVKPVTARDVIDRLNTVIYRPRPFVRTPDYFGPLRRGLDDAKLARLSPQGIAEI